MDRLTIRTEGTDPVDARRTASRVAELLGVGMSAGSVMRPRRRTIVDVQLAPGLSGERLAAYVADAIRRQLR
jgi:hypothetical protein